jgi:hypothetical protein
LLQYDAVMDLRGMKVIWRERRRQIIEHRQTHSTDETAAHFGVSRQVVYKAHRRANVDLCGISIGAS